MDYEPRGPVKWLTVPGRLLLAGTIMGFGCGTWLFLGMTIDSMPRGSYPVFFWAVPVLIVAVAFFFIVAKLLERCGVKVYRKDDTIAQ